MKALNTMKVSFPSRSANEGFARSAVAAFAAQADPTMDELADIKTAVSEAVTNCIVHAYPNVIGPVTLTAALQEDGVLRIVVADKGCGIDDAVSYTHLYGGRIVEQLKKLGCSCDWQRERFTMDEGCSKAVLKVFKKLYDEGLIYRGERIINWCPHCKTSISDAEVEYEEQDGFFWHLKYPVKGTDEFVELATTRPETMLGDTAIAVNPADGRYTHLHGKTVILPLVNKEIPVVTDDYVDMEFGTGVVKITPAHDPNDFEVGVRHSLPIVKVLTDDAHMNEACGKYAGMDRYEARKALSLIHI